MVSRLKLSYILTSAIALLITLYLLLARSNLPILMVFIFFSTALLISVVLWYGIVYPLSKEKD